MLSFLNRLCDCDGDYDLEPEKSERRRFLEGFFAGHEANIQWKKETSLYSTQFEYERDNIAVRLEYNAIGSRWTGLYIWDGNSSAHILYHSASEIPYSDISWLANRFNLNERADQAQSEWEEAEQKKEQASRATIEKYIN